MINIIVIGISIAWLWLGVRLNYLRHGAVFENLYVPKKVNKDIDELTFNRKLERKGKIITTLVLLILGVIDYSYNDQSLVLVYVLSVGWLLFYLIDLEVSSIYKVIDRKEKIRDKTQQYIMDKFREIEK